MEAVADAADGEHHHLGGGGEPGRPDAGRRPGARRTVPGRRHRGPGRSVRDGQGGVAARGQAHRVAGGEPGHLGVRHLHGDQRAVGGAHDHPPVAAEEARADHGCRAVGRVLDVHPLGAHQHEGLGPGRRAGQQRHAATEQEGGGRPRPWPRIRLVRPTKSATNGVCGALKSSAGGGRAARAGRPNRADPVGDREGLLLVVGDEERRSADLGWMRRISSRSWCAPWRRAPRAACRAAAPAARSPGRGPVRRAAAGRRRAGGRTCRRAREADEVEHLAGAGPARDLVAAAQLRPNSTFWRAVMCGKRLYAWKTIPMSRLLADTRSGPGRRPRCCPSRGPRGRPGSAARWSCRPDGPSRATNSPGLDVQGQAVQRRTPPYTRCRSVSRTAVPRLVSVMRRHPCGRRGSVGVGRRARAGGAAAHGRHRNSTAKAKTRASSPTATEIFASHLPSWYIAHLEVLLAEQARDGELPEHQGDREERGRQHRRAQVGQHDAAHHGGTMMPRVTVPPRTGCARRWRAARHPETGIKLI